MDYVVPLASARDAGRFGPKAAQLAALGDVPGARVPEGFAIEARAFEDTLAATLPRSQWPAELLSAKGDVRQAMRLEAIRQRVLSASMPPAIRGEIAAAYSALGGALVAVRSSALHEDQHDASAAGLQDTVLGVAGVDAVYAAVLRCFASIYQERAMTYLARRPASARRQVSVAVVVQRMVRADAAGVLFTVDPVSRERGVMVVEAAHGLGCSVVDGGISPDVFRVERPSGRVLSRNLGDKPAAVRVRDDGGTWREPVDESMRRAAAVSDAEIKSLCALGESVERHVGGARDIEWAFEDGVLWALQSRPIVGFSTGGADAKGGIDDPSTWVWSNVNVGEALPGVATPLTWSVAAAFSDLGFRRAFGALGCVVPERIELVGSFHGRIYLNLTNFMRIARQVPVLNAKMLLEFGGGGGLDVIERQVEPGQWGPFLLKLPVTGARYVAENAGLDLRVDRFDAEFRATRDRIMGLDMGAITSRGLDALFEELLALLDRTGAVMLTCASGYLSSVVGIRTVLRIALGDDADRFERDLLSGVTDLESAAPGISLFHIAEIARNDPPARAMLTERDPATLSLDALPAGPTRRAFAGFLHAYGYRCPREAELSTPRWRESPATLFAALRAYLLQGDDTSIRRAERQNAIRAEAEAELIRRVPPVARSVVRHLVQRTWRFSRLRERLRARVTEVLGFFRIAALEASKRIERACPTAGPDAAFYLHIAELRAWLAGSLEDPASVVAVRRAQVARDIARPDPPPTFVGFPPTTSPTTIPSGDRWSGVGASPGVVTGVVRVLRDPADGASLQPGEVLVTAVADVGWTPLFLMAAAVVTELGGALSHAALVAREYGVPAVVNVPGITRALRNGDRVRVDGDRGIVEREASAEVVSKPPHSTAN
ncbi:MAG: PEP/pyruvate-binding domain-containing protein [Polyangiales bacterium]